MASIPKLFKQRFSERDFRKKILSRLHLKGDKELVNGVYGRDESGDYVRRERLSEDEIERLGKLAREIKANRGVVRRGRLIIAGVLVVLIVVFNLVFKNRLVTTAVERGLEGVFRAESEVTGLGFGPLRGYVRFRHLTVADRARPFRNLFELGRTEIRLDTLELLKGKVVIRNLECRDILWNTERTTSGSLPGALAAESADSPAPSDEKPGADRLFRGLPSVDPEELLRRHLDRLSSPEVLRKLNEEMSEVERTWTDRIRETRRSLAELSDSVDSVRAIRPGSIDSVTELRSALDRIGDVAPAVEKAEAEVTDAHGRLVEELEDIEESGERIRRAISDDYSYLESLVDSPESMGRNLVSSLASGYLKRALGGYYGYAVRAVGYAEQLRAQGGKKERDRGARRGAGVDVPFPALVYPRFLLQRLFVSVGGQDERRSLEGSLRSLSSDQDLAGEPVSFRLSQRLEETAVRLSGWIDTRRDREEDLRVELAADGFGFRVTEGLELIRLDGIRGLYAFRTDFRLGSGGAAEGKAVLELSEVDLSPAPGDHPVATAVSEILTSVETVSIEVSYRVSEDRELSLEAASSLDRVVSERIGAYLREQASEYREKLKAELDRRIADELERNAAVQAAVRELAADSRGNLDLARSYSNVMEQRRGEIEARIRSLQKKGEERLKDEAAEKLDEARKKLGAPKLPF